MLRGICTGVVGLVALGVAFSATAAPDSFVSGNVTYELDDAQTGFTNYGPAANNGIDFNPNVSNFLTSGSTAFAFLDFQVYGNDAGGGNVFAFDDFDFTLNGVIGVVIPPGSVDISITGTVDVIAASDALGVPVGNPGSLLTSSPNSKFDALSSVTGVWSSTLSWNMFDDFLDGSPLFDASVTGLDFSLSVAITATNGISLSQITDAMTDVGVSVQPGVAVPEPSTGALVALGLAGLGAVRRSRSSLR